MSNIPLYNSHIGLKLQLKIFGTHFITLPDVTKNKKNDIDLRQEGI